MQVQIKQYKPGRRGNAPRVPESQWNKYMPLLRDLHDRKLTREAMLVTLNAFGFFPSICQLNTKMKALGFHRYGIDPETSSASTSSPFENSTAHSSSLSPHNIPEQDDMVGSSDHDSIPGEVLIDVDTELSQPISSGIDTAKEQQRLLIQFECCLKDTLDGWIESGQEQIPHFSYEWVMKQSASPQELQASADFAYVSGRTGLAYDFNMMVLCRGLYMSELRDPYLVNSLVRCGLISLLLQSEAQDLVWLFITARRFFVSTNLLGAALCMELVCEVLNRRDGCTNELLRSIIRHLALYLVDVSPMKEDLKQLGSAYERALINMRHVCDPTENYTQEYRFIDFLFDNLSTVWFEQQHLLTDACERIWSVKAWSQWTRSLPIQIEDETGHTSSWLDIVFSSATRCQMLVCLAIQQGWNASLHVRYPGSDYDLKVIICRSMDKILGSEHVDLHKLLLDQWLSKPSTIDFEKQSIVYLMSNLGNADPNRMQSHFTINDWSTLRNIVKPPRLALTKDVDEMQKELDITQVDTQQQEQQLPLHPAPRTFVLDSFTRPYPTLKSKGTKSISSATHSSWSFHRGSGYPKVTSSVASDHIKAMHDFENAESLDTASPKEVLPDMDLTLVADLSEKVERDWKYLELGHV